MMIDVALKLTALFSAAWLVSFLLRGRAASTRHAVWAGLMAAALVLPVFGALAPQVELAWLPADPPRMQQPQPAPAFDSGRHAGVERALLASERVSAGTVSASAPRVREASGLDITPTRAAAIAWIFIALLLGARIVAAHVVARRMLRSCGEPPPALARALASVAAELNVREPRLRIAPAGTMPAVIGLLRASVILPADAIRWSADRLRLVLLHECAHVRRRDALMQVIASAATAVYWWHPLTWLAARRMVRERELACDDLVIASGTPGSDYAEHLLDIARALKPSRQPALAALAMARPSELEGRLIALLEPRPREARPVRALALGAGLALVALVAVAPLKLVARAAALMPPDAPQAIALPEDQEIENAAPMPSAANQAASAPAAQARAQAQPAPRVNDAFTDALLRGLDDEDNDVRMMSMLALSRLETEKSVPLLVRALEDADEDIRALALASLIHMDREEARAFLARGVRDPSDDVRAMALVGLRKLNHPDRRALTLRAATDAAGDVRALAALTLANETGEDVDAMLVTLSADPEPDVRRAALFAIAKRAGLGLDGPDWLDGSGLGAGIASGIAEGIAAGIAGGISGGIAGGVAGVIPGGIIRK